jgi:hypothetical protein
MHSGPLLRVTIGYVLLYMAPNRVLLHQALRSCIAVGELRTPQSFLPKNCLS